MQSNHADNAATSKTPLKYSDVVKNYNSIPNHDSDLEAASTATSVGTSYPEDPFNTRDGIIPEEQLSEIRRRKGKRVAKYQARQNDLITSLLKPLEEHTAEAISEGKAAEIPVRIAIYASLIANFALCIIQMWAAITAESYSLLSTGIDSIFDLGSNVLLFYLHYKAENLDVNKWPVGGARLETIGNIVYGFLMASVNLIVVVESGQSLYGGSDDDLKKFHLPAILAVATALGVKFLLFLYCFSLRNKSSQVLVLWEDHRNDLFINGFGIIMSLSGSKIAWWLDPAGAIIIAMGVIISWSHTLYSQFELLAGKSAPHEFLQLLIYKVATSCEEVQKVDTVRAYHSGPDYFVEIDIVMDPHTELWKAHDVSEELQKKIEVLPRVERCFVHVDHEATHTPEHRKPASR